MGGWVVGGPGPGHFVGPDRATLWARTGRKGGAAIGAQKWGPKCGRGLELSPKWPPGADPHFLEKAGVTVARRRAFSEIVGLIFFASRFSFFGPSWDHLGAISGPSWGHLGAILWPSSPLALQPSSPPALQPSSPPASAEAETETHRHTPRHTDTHTHTDTDTHRHTRRHTPRRTPTHTDTYADTHAQTHRQTHRQTHTDTQTHTQTDTHRHTHNH